MTIPHLLLYLGHGGIITPSIHLGNHDIFPTNKVVDQILPQIPGAVSVSDYSFRIDIEDFIYMFERYFHPDNTSILSGILLDRNFVNRTRLLKMQTNYYAGHVT